MVGYFSGIVPGSLRRMPTAKKVTLSHWLTILVAALLASACASAPKPADGPGEALVFPPPPEEPRFYFEMTLTSSTQVTTDRKQARLREMLTGEIETGEGMAKPFDVTVCRGVVFVTDTVRRRVLAFDFPARRVYHIGDDEPGGLIKPLGLASDAQCRIYVADVSLRRVMIYERDGKFVDAVGGPEWFNRISHVAVTPDGSRIYAVDTGGVDTDEHRVRVFDGQGRGHLFDIGGRGTEPGKFNLPRDVALAPNGDLYVVDGGNFRVQVFDAEGRYLRSFGAAGAQYGQFSRPKGIAADREGNMYVSDTAFGNFQIFDSEGRLLLFVGDRSNEPGPARYMLPAGIHVDEDGRVYFVDQYFRKVDIYRPARLEKSEGHLAGRPRDGGTNGQAASGK